MPARKHPRSWAAWHCTPGLRWPVQCAVRSPMVVLHQLMCMWSEFSDPCFDDAVHLCGVSVCVPWGNSAKSVLMPDTFSVKTRIQLDPVTYNRGMIGGFRQVVANEGAGALLTGFGPTAAGYFLQGAFKFGGYELFKQQFINYFGYETASNNRTAVYLASSAAAEFFADIALCPLEATRIRLVSEPTFASGLVSGFGKIAKTEGLGAFYSGFGPILFKQWVRQRPWREEV